MWYKPLMDVIDYKIAVDVLFVGNKKLLYNFLSWE